MHQEVVRLIVGCHQLKLEGISTFCFNYEKCIKNICKNKILCAPTTWLVMTQSTQSTALQNVRLWAFIRLECTCASLQTEYCICPVATFFVISHAQNQGHGWGLCSEYVFPINLMFPALTTCPATSWFPNVWFYQQCPFNLLTFKQKMIKAARAMSDTTRALGSLWTPKMMVLVPERPVLLAEPAPKSQESAN